MLPYTLPCLQRTQHVYVNSKHAVYKLYQAGQYKRRTAGYVYVNLIVLGSGLGRSKFAKGS